jgi:GTPase SAR1 family protein
MESEDYHFKFRIVILGDKSVGKTAFLESQTSNFGKVVDSD